MTAHLQHTMTDSPTSDSAAQEGLGQCLASTPIFKVLKGNPTSTEITAIQCALDMLQAEAKQRYKATERNQWGGVEEMLNQISRQVFNPNAYSTSTYH